MNIRNVKGKKVVIGLEVRNMRNWRERRSFKILEGKEEFGGTGVGVGGRAWRKWKGKKRRSIDNCKDRRSKNWREKD